MLLKTAGPQAVCYQFMVGKEVGLENKSTQSPSSEYLAI